MSLMETFYLRIARQGDREFEEFECNEDGRCRMTNLSEYKMTCGGTMGPEIRKEMHISQLTMEALRKVVEDSEVMSEDPQSLPLPDRHRHDEVELVLDGRHLFFKVRVADTFLQATDFRILYYFLLDVRLFMLSLFKLHFRCSPFGSAGSQVRLQRSARSRSPRRHRPVAAVSTTEIMTNKPLASNEEQLGSSSKFLVHQSEFDEDAQIIGARVMDVYLGGDGWPLDKALDLWQALNEGRRLVKEEPEPVNSDDIGNDTRLPKPAVEEHRLKLPTHERCAPVYDILFTHDSISSRFSDGRPLSELVNALRKGQVDVKTDDFLCLDVVRYRGKLYCLRNRRLWCLKEYQRHQRQEVRVRVVVHVLSPVGEKFVGAFTTRNGGSSVLVRP